MKLTFKKIGLLFFALILLRYFFFFKNTVQCHDLIAYNKIVNANSLSLLNGVGNISFIPNEGQELNIQCQVIYKGSDPYDFSEKTKHVNLIPRIENNIIYLEAMAKDLNYWQWLDENIDDANISVHYLIKLPTYIKHLKIINNVGDINITDLSVSLDLELSMGNIDCSNVSVLGHSNIFLKNGDLNFSSDLLSNVDTMFHYVELGDINFFVDNFADVKRVFNKVGQGTIQCILPPKIDYIVDNRQLSQIIFPLQEKVLLKEKLLHSEDYRIETFYREQLLKNTTFYNIDFDDNVLSEETLYAMNRNNTLVGNHVDFGHIMIK